jgi:hypothetical protein
MLNIVLVNLILLNVILWNVIVQNVILLNGILFTTILLNVILLNVVLLTVILVSVVAPKTRHSNDVMKSSTGSNRANSIQPPVTDRRNVVRRDDVVDSFYNDASKVIDTHVDVSVDADVTKDRTSPKFRRDFVKPVHVSRPGQQTPTFQSRKVRSFHY